MTISEVLKDAKTALADRETSHLDAEVLLCFVLGVERSYLFANSDEELGSDLLKLFNLYLEKAINGEPLAYITNQKEFYGLDFFVDKRVLIPRPETELLVEEVLGFIEAEDFFEGELKILDVGTGSGNIAISLAKKLSEAEVLHRVDGVDVSSDALEVAKMNAYQNSVEDTTHFFESDLLEFLLPDEDTSESEVFSESYDVIVANLPYIGKDRNTFVDEDTFNYEPHLALFAGASGLELYEKLFSQIVNNNLSFKLLIGEFGFGQGEEMEALLASYFPNFNWEICKDLADIDRYFMVRSV